MAHISQTNRIGCQNEARTAAAVLLSLVVLFPSFFTRLSTAAVLLCSTKLLDVNQAFFVFFSSRD